MKNQSSRYTLPSPVWLQVLGLILFTVFFVLLSISSSNTWLGDVLIIASILFLFLAVYGVKLRLVMQYHHDDLKTANDAWSVARGHLFKLHSIPILGFIVTYILRNQLHWFIKEIKYRKCHELYVRGLHNLSPRQHKGTMDLYIEKLEPFNEAREISDPDIDFHYWLNWLEILLGQFKFHARLHARECFNRWYELSIRHKANEVVKTGQRPLYDAPDGFTKDDIDDVYQNQIAYAFNKASVAARIRDKLDKIHASGMASIEGTLKLIDDVFVAANTADETTAVVAVH